MAKIYPPLNSVDLNAGTEYVHSGELPEILHVEDSAFDAMVDFKETKAFTIHQDKPIDEALASMRVCRVHEMVVINDNDTVVGLISSEDILGEKPIKITEEKLIHRSAIKVRLVMTPADEITTIPIEELKIAKIGHVVTTLRSTRQHYALVIEHPTGNHRQRIRGLFSWTHISKQLNMNIEEIA